MGSFRSLGSARSGELSFLRVCIGTSNQWKSDHFGAVARGRQRLAALLQLVGDFIGAARRFTVSEEYGAWAWSGPIRSRRFWWSRPPALADHDASLRRTLGSNHDHEQVGRPFDTTADGIRATKVSLIVLGVTAGLRAMIAVVSGSVALMSDTIHNLGDALTSIPLWIAFALGRRGPTRSYSYGFHRAEDLAGLVIVAAIGLSAVLIVIESLGRFVEPRLMGSVPWVIAAGLIGALGSELVARYRIRVGNRIGSAALVADGHHARIDALTSLAVVVAAVGATIGAAWVDQWPDWQWL